MNHGLWICFIFLFLLSLSIPCLIKRLCILQVCFISVGKLDFFTYLCKAFCALKTSLLHFFSVELYLQASTNFYINKAKSIYHSSLIQRTLEVGSTEKWLQKIELLRKNYEKKRQHWMPRPLKKSVMYQPSHRWLYCNRQMPYVLVFWGYLEHHLCSAERKN